MFQELYEELSKIEWKFHLLQNMENGVILLTPVSLDPNGIQEVMLIKEVADRYRFHTLWDGEKITIVEEQQGAQDVFEPSISAVLAVLRRRLMAYSRLSAPLLSPHASV